jgi:methylmalonyl-CoA mutase cobalamin-binding domain/chain
MGNPPARTTLDWIADHSASLAGEVLRALGLPDSPSLRETLQLFLDDLEASLLVDESVLLAEQLRWQASRLGVLAADIGVDRLVAATLDVLGDQLDSGELQALREHVERAQAQRQSLLAKDHPAGGGHALSAATRAYVDHVVAGERDEAVRLVMGAVEGGHDVRGLLLEVLQPAQVEIGRLWETGAITIAQEHFATAVTELVMSLLYPHLFGGFPSGRRLVAVGTGSSGHEIGIRMVADLLSTAGWSTSYLGCGVPCDEVVQELVSRGAHVLAVSATMAAHVPEVRRLVAAVRSEPRCSGVKVVVGGRAFRLAPRLVAHVGADAVARDAVEAISVCDALVPLGTV